MGRPGDPGPSVRTLVDRVCAAPWLRRTRLRPARASVHHPPENRDEGNHLISRSVHALRQERRCPPGRERAPDEKRYGAAQFRCTCGNAGTMPYPNCSASAATPPLDVEMPALRPRTAMTEANSPKEVDTQPSAARAVMNCEPCASCGDRTPQTPTSSFRSAANGVARSALECRFEYTR
jgi:hypothetical protein